MVMQRHEEIKHHRGPRPCVDPTPLDARGAVFFMLSHTSVWDFHIPSRATNMSLNLVYFKAHPRGFKVGAINWSLGDLRRGFLKGEGDEKRRLECKA